MDIDEADEAIDGPEFEAWNHLQKALDLASRELDGFPEQQRTWLKTLGKEIVSVQTNLVADEGNRLADVSRLLLNDPWIRFAADLAFAEECRNPGVDRI